MGIKEDASERVLRSSLAAVIRAGEESKVPTAVLARLLLEEVRRLVEVGDDALRLEVASFTAEFLPSARQAGP